VRCFGAIRYLLDRLKGLCEDAIRKSITCRNVVSIFMAAHRHRAADLKVCSACNVFSPSATTRTPRAAHIPRARGQEICLEFIIEFLDDVKRSRGFRELKQEPELLLEIIMRQPGGGGASLLSADGSGGKEAESDTD